MPDQNQTDPTTQTLTDTTQTSAVPTTPIVAATDPTNINPAAQQPTPTVPTFFPTEDVPPAPDFQTVPAAPPVATDTVAVPNPIMANSPVQQPENSGSAAPVDFPTMTSSPKKKFGGGKVIATILGLFVLIGGVGAGIVLTQQQQILQPQAVADGECNCKTADTHQSNCGAGSCNSNGSCNCKSGCTTKANRCSVQHTSNPDTGCILDARSCVFDNHVPGGFCGGSNGKKWCQHNQAELGEGINGGHGGTTAATCTCPAGEHKGSAGAGGGYAFCLSNTACNYADTCSSGNDTRCNNTGDTASCTNVKAYNTSWAVLSAAQLAALTPGTHINFCVTGTASGGSFDKAKFTINGAVQAETTTKRPGNQDFCQNYAIPTGVSTFDVTAQIHHTTLGWK